MLNPIIPIEGLTVAGCRSRQARLAKALQAAQVDQILICDRQHVYYLSGYRAASYHAPLLVVTSEAKSQLVAPDAVELCELPVDGVSYYESQRLGTLIESQFGAAIAQLRIETPTTGKCGIDLPQVVLRGFADMVDLSQELLALRRAKEDDEVELIRAAVRGCEAAYAHAANILRPGIREIDVFAEMQAAAVKELGEPLGEMGNDFQAGSPGGPPRIRPIEMGELMPLDVAISVRGYRCDLCRTFAIGHDPTPQQLEAARRVQAAIAYVEQNAKVGSSCRQLFESVKQQLDGVNGWRFFHHLGHGTGLSPHEAPRLNPHWNDDLKIGDVFTIEPGLYHEDLRAGVRIEHNYWMSPAGLCRLSNYPTSL